MPSAAGGTGSGAQRATADLSAPRCGTSLLYTIDIMPSPAPHRPCGGSPSMSRMAMRVPGKWYQPGSRLQSFRLASLVALLRWRLDSESGVTMVRLCGQLAWQIAGGGEEGGEGGSAGGEGTAGGAASSSLSAAQATTPYVGSLLHAVEIPVLQAPELPNS